MKWFGIRSMRRLSVLMHRDLSSVLSSVAAAFEEVYANMDALNEKIGGTAYLSGAETICVPGAACAYADETAGMPDQAVRMDGETAVISGTSGNGQPEAQAWT